MSLTVVVDTVTPPAVVALSATENPASTPVNTNNTGSAKLEQDESDFEFIEGSQEGTSDTYTGDASEASDDGDTHTDDATDDGEDSDGSTDPLVGIVGELYQFVPTHMVMDPTIVSETFYAVYVGRSVGITTESSIATALMTKVPGGSQKAFKTQEGAVAAFNMTLRVPGAVRVAYM